jgi:hypothetical protein
LRKITLSALQHQNRLGDFSETSQDCLSPSLVVQTLMKFGKHIVAAFSVRPSGNLVRTSSSKPLGGDSVNLHRSDKFHP